MRRSVARESLAFALCTTLAFGTLPSFASKPKPALPKPSPVDHAALLVNRFTFGPTPGEIERARALGPEMWFEQQLNPERIPDTTLNARLAQYPALQMSQDERIERYPTPNQIRQFAKTSALPQDPELRTIVADQVEFYRERQKAKPGAIPTLAKSTAYPAGTTPANPPAPIVRIGPTGLQVPVRLQVPVGVQNSAAAQVPAVVPPPEQDLEQSIAPMSQSQLDALLAAPPAGRYAQVMHLPVDRIVALRKGLHNREDKLFDGMTPLQKETLAVLNGTNRMITNELLGGRLLRDIYSSRELEAVMTDFWLNHFNIYIKKDGQMPALLPQFQQTVQQFALGRFSDLLLAVARSPAMLLYLDNTQSIGPDSFAAGANAKNPNVKRKKNIGLNENYARELMELHTLGVNGGYTQHDVTEVANVFTGWTTDQPGDGGRYTFNSRRHQPGSKTVLGKVVPEGGEREGEQVLQMLADSPATAHFLSLELAERFVADTPPPALVDRMATTFLQTDGDIKAVLRTMVYAPEFFTPATVHAKLKTPLEYVVSAVRITGADVQNPQPLVQTLERLGMPLYGCQPPTGYKWDAETWLSSSALISRMNFALLLSSDRVAGTTVVLPAPPQAGRVGTTLAHDPAVQERALESALLDSPASSQTRNAVLSRSGDSAVPEATRVVTAAPGAQQSTDGRRIVPVNAAGANLPKPGSAHLDSALPGSALPDKQERTMLGLLLGSPEFQKR